MGIVLQISNTTDLNNQIKYTGYVGYLYLDEEHLVEHNFKRPQIEREEKNDDGEDFIERIFYFEEWEIKFIYNKDSAEYISGLKEFNTLVITDEHGDTITPYEWDVKIGTIDEADVFNEITIIYRVNQITKTRRDTNYTKTIVTPNQPPQAQNVQGTGTGFAGGYQTADISDVCECTYTYYDPDGDPEGVTTFQWYRSGRFGYEIISGATSYQYTVTNDDLNKFIKCKVTPVAQTGELVGTPVYSNEIKISTNAAPVATVLDIDGNLLVGETLNVDYSYSDAEGDLEGATEFEWYRADSDSGLGQILVGTSSSYIVANDDRGKWLRYKVKPIALTGTLEGEWEWSPDWEWVDDQS